MADPTPTPLTDSERAILLEPCECFHIINDHGERAGCWTCRDDPFTDRPCAVSFSTLLAERVDRIVAARVTAARAKERDRIEGVTSSAQPADTEEAGRG